MSINKVVLDVDTSNMLNDINIVLKDHLQSQFRSLMKEKEEMEKNIKYIYNLPLVIKLQKNISKLTKENVKLKNRIRDVEGNLVRYEQYAKLKLEIKEIEKEEGDKKEGEGEEGDEGDKGEAGEEGEEGEDNMVDIRDKWNKLCEPDILISNQHTPKWDLDDLSSSDEDESDNHSSDGVTKLDELNMGVFQGDEEKNIYVKGGDAGGGEEEEKEDSPLELFELKHNGTTYYTNNSDSGFLYECIDGKVGKKVGNLEDGKPFFS